MVGCETQDQLMRAGRDMMLVQASMVDTIFNIVIE